MLTGILWAVFALTAGPLQPAEAQENPRFRSSVDLVSVAAVVRDRKGRFVTDLTRQDFEIVEAGELRPILDFRSEPAGPIKVAVLVDVSGSMRLGQRSTDARQMATHVFSHLGPGDLAAIYTFDAALSEAQAFTASLEQLTVALESVEQPYGQTSLYDAIAETARHVAGTVALQRVAIAVITDGVDTRSRMTPRDVARAASGIDVPVYIVAVAAGVDDPRHPGRRSARLVSDLQQLAHGTGGELFVASAPEEASEVARQMVSELRHQYVLAFESSDRAGWHPLEVRTRHDSYVVRARTGYSAGGARSEEESGLQ